GNGVISTFGYGRRALGGDWYGRVNFNSYFRPPGLPIQTYVAGDLNTPNIPGPLQPNTTPHAALNPDRTNNPDHGLEAYLAPTPRAGPPPLSGLQLAGMPANWDSTQNQEVPVTSGAIGAAGFLAPPTFDYRVNTQMNNDGLNEADEMNLYGS